jgi:hypothetical protein
VAWVGEVWLFVAKGRLDFFNFPRNFFWVVWDGVVGEMGSVFFSFFLL